MTRTKPWGFELIWPPLTAASGVSALALLVTFSLLPAARAAYPHGDFASAMDTFQQVRTPADLARVFGAPVDQLRVMAMERANNLDLYRFIPAYGLFLFAGGAMLARSLKNPLVWLAIAPLAVGIVGDVLETSAQLRITGDMAHANAALPIAPFAQLKWFALAFSAVGASAICFIGAPKRLILAVLGLGPIVGTLATTFGAPPAIRTAGFALFWLPLLGVAVLEMARQLEAMRSARDASP